MFKKSAPSWTQGWGLWWWREKELVVNHRFVCHWHPSGTISLIVSDSIPLSVHAPFLFSFFFFIVFFFLHWISSLVFYFGNQSCSSRLTFFVNAYFALYVCVCIRILLITWKERRNELQKDTVDVWRHRKSGFLTTGDKQSNSTLSNLIKPFPFYDFRVHWFTVGY